MRFKNLESKDLTGGRTRKFLTASFVTRMFVALMMLTGLASKTWADNATVTVNLKCNNPSLVTFSQSVPTSSSSSANNTAAPEITWSGEADADGYFTATYTATPFYTSSWGGLIKTGYVMYFRAQLVDGYYFSAISGVSATCPTNAEVALINGTKYTSNTTLNVTLDVYPAETHSGTTSVNLNFAGSNVDYATVAWNDETITGTSATKSLDYSYRDVNGVYLDGDKIIDFDNSITITPARPTVIVNWELRNGDGVAEKSGSVSENATEILNWNTGNTDYDGYTLWYECIETTVTEASNTLTLNFAASNPTDVTVGWTANGNAVAIEGTSATYTHDYVIRTSSGVVLNPDDEYYDNALTLTMKKGIKANWTLTKGGSAIASGECDGTSAPIEIYAWNTKTQNLDGAVLAYTSCMNDDAAYFILKADPAHFTKITGGSYGTNYETDELKFSLEGEINIVDDPTKQYYIKTFLNGNVVYDFERFAPGATTAETSAKGKVASGSHMVYQSGKNQRIVVLTSDKLLDGEWGYTVIGNPDHISVREYYNYANISMECSAEGVEYKSTQPLTTPQILPKDKNLICNAYFFPAGADINDKSQAFDSYPNITFSNTTSWKYATTKTSGIANTLANGGILLIESSLTGAGNITVNVDDASSVNLKMGENSVTLSNGSNTIELNNKFLIFSHATNTKKFYKFTRNGVEIAANSESGEGGGKVTYSYNISNAADGDVFDIEADYPAGPHNVYINVPEGCAEFVQSVTVDDVETEWTNGTPLSVAGGKTVRVQGDVFGYIVNGTRINGEDKPASASASLIIAGETTFDFDVTKIVRDKSFTFECKNTAKALLVTNLGSKMSISAGATVTVPLCDADNPINFSVDYVGSSQSEQAGVWRVNGTLAASGDIALNKFKVNDGDEINVEFVGSSSAPTTLSVTLGATGMYSYVGYLPLTFAESDAVKAYIATECVGGKIKMERVVGNVPARTGLMLVGEKNATVNISLAEEGDASLVEDNLFTGVFKNEIIPGSGNGMYTYVFGTVSGTTGFWQMNGDKLCDNGNHAYLRSEQNLLSSAAKCLSLVFDDGDITGISTVQSSEVNGHDSIYNLEGQKVGADYKGIVIKNGKKVVVK